MLIKIAVVAGDGIGPEVTDQAIFVLEEVASVFGHELLCVRKNIGGAALKSNKDPLPNDTLQACLSSGAVLLGAVGGPSFDSFPSHLRPESGLLRLRRELGVFANLRPAKCYPSLEDSSPLRPDVVRGTDLLIVRELLGGIYYGEPRLIQGPTGDRTATDTMRYTEKEIERVAHVAFELARERRRNLVSVDKANVLDCSRLWRDVVTRVSHDYSDVKTSHMYVDSAAMALVSRPADFDVVLTENMFGDILSDQSASIVGSLGMLGSASLGGPVALYEPIHGSAPDIAGQGIANPVGSILSAALMLRHSFKLHREASCIELCVAAVLAAGNRTKDVAHGQRYVSTQEMGARIGGAIRSTFQSGAAAN
jgi:3-isopropylmalate dehydrogenase